MPAEAYIRGFGATSMSSFCEPTNKAAIRLSNKKSPLVVSNRREGD